MLSVILVAVVFLTPNTYREIFLTRSLMIQISDVIVNVLIFTLILYPISCVIVSIYHGIKKYICYRKLLLSAKRLIHIDGEYNSSPVV